MLHRLSFLAFLGCLFTSQSFSATATTTLQLIWPGDIAGIDPDQAMEKATNFLNSDDYVRDVTMRLSTTRDEYCRSVGINNPRNSDAISQAIRSALTIQPDPERHVFTLSLTNPREDIALAVAKVCATTAIRDARFYIAELTDPKTKQVKTQMESIEDQLQQYQAQLRIMKQENRATRATHSQGASIGAPIGIIRTQSDPARLQRQAAASNINQQMSGLKKQYHDLRLELSKSVNEAMKGKPKMGLVMIDHPDLDT
ncbi:MAG: hypothetical protein AAFX93_03530 [Verrucomicrobiota bacterium]